MTDAWQSGFEFEFVMQDPNESFSREIQTTIRKQAMRAIGATRRRSHRRSPTSISRYRTRRDSDLAHPLPPMPLSGLELLVKDRGIDPIDLSALSSIHIGTMASIILSSDPNRLSGVLSCRQRSYFSYIPPRFGQVSVLDDAFRCLITVTHSMLVPAHKSSQKTILSYYGRALYSLQSAVNDPSLRYSVEVLCATAILALFELLNSPNAQPWRDHIAGASRLIQLRGPSRFTSEFDKSLFISLSYPICSEALLNNEHCFLDDPAWTEFIRTLSVPTEMFTDRSDLGIDLMVIKSKVAGLAKRTNHAVVIQDTLELRDFEAIAFDISVVRSAIVTWRRKFNTALIHAEERSRDDTMDFGKRYELLGLSLIINIVVSRLLCSIVPKDRALLEEEVQNQAVELKAVAGSLEHNRRAEFFFAQKGKIADAAIATHVYFQDVLDSGEIIERWRLEKFFEAMGRKCCSGETCCNSNV